MKIPVLNPNRPPKAWWYSCYSEVRKDKDIDDPAAVCGWIWYHHMGKKRKKEVLSKEELQTELRRYKKIRKNRRPAKATQPSQKEPLMARRKSRSRKRRARVMYRANVWSNDAAGHAKAARKGWRRRKRRKNWSSSPMMNRKRRKSSRRRNPWSSGPRSFTPLSMRSNPYRRTRRRRRNPNLPTAIRGVFSQRNIMNAAKVGGGIVAGTLTIPMLYTISPAALQAQSRFFGLANVLVGGLLVGLVRNKDVKDMGVIIAGVGMYDLIQQNVPQLNLPAIPRSNPMISGMLPTTGTSASYMPLAASYMTAARPASQVARAGVGASYLAPRTKTVGLQGDWEAFANDPYKGIFQ